MNVTKQQYSQPIGHFTQVRWQVVRPLQLYSLSRLNLNPFTLVLVLFTVIKFSVFISYWI